MDRAPIPQSDGLRLLFARAYARMTPRQHFELAARDPRAWEHARRAWQETYGGGVMAAYLGSFGNPIEREMAELDMRLATQAATALRHHLGLDTGGTALAAFAGALLSALHGNYGTATHLMNVAAGLSLPDREDASK